MLESLVNTEQQHGVACVHVANSSGNQYSQRSVASVHIANSNGNQYNQGSKDELAEINPTTSECDSDRRPRAWPCRNGLSPFVNAASGVPRDPAAVCHLSSGATATRNRALAISCS